MLNLHQLSEQFSDFSAYQADEHTRREEQLRHALDALADCSSSWEELHATVQQEKPTRLVAGLREAPDTTYPKSERPTPVTVVATDGSQIYPDRHFEPPCYLLNISRVAFQYGTLEHPVLEATPDFRYRDCQLSDHFDHERGAMTSEVVSALRDEEELRALLDASRRARCEGRPLVALADGTLIRWMIRGMRNRGLEEELIGRYADLLAAFHEQRLPLCSYVSMPGNTEMINLLGVHLDDEAVLQGLLDRRLFTRTLQPGERSATFTSASRIQRAYGPENEICYFYVHVPSEVGEGEIGRVEMPQWVAEDDELLRCIHSVILSECAKGNGYPMILSEAHEQAVIRIREKELFYRMIDRTMQGTGLPHRRSRKAQSKRQPAV